MDGLTQGLLGAAATQSVYARSLGRASFLVGLGAGMLADADFVVRSSSDPLLTLAFHRGMTHALIFIPLGGLIAALPFLAWPALRARWRQVIPAAILGYATHGVLDALTAYGTQLLWPFSDHRVSGDIMPVVDPFFSLTLLAGTVWATVKRSTRPARVALAIAIAYILFAAVQHGRASSAQEQLIAARGHQAEDARVIPTPLAVVLHRSIYLAGGRIHADAIRTPLLGSPTYRPGGSIEVFDPAAAGLPEAARRPDRMARDLARYRWFTDGFWARVPDRPGVIGDYRITADPAGLNPLWGMQLAPTAEIPATRTSLGRDFDVGGYLRELVGGDDRHRPLPDSTSLPAARAPLPIDEGAGERSATMLALGGDCEAGFPSEGRLACHQACDLGHSNSCARLASHLEADGGADELAAALHLHLEACAGGSGLGCEGAAAMFARGAGGPADADRSAELYRKARTYHRVHCEQRFAPSCAAAARLYREGLGGPPDAAVAGDYARRACDLGIETACAGGPADLSSE
jgi:inner membrane protein